MVTASRELNISGTKLSNCQLSAIFQAIQRADVLEELEIKEENLKYVPTQRITPCIAALKRVIIDDCSTNNEPVEETKVSKHSEDSLCEILLKGIHSNHMEFLNLGKIQLHCLSTGQYLTCSRLKKVELEQVFSTLMTQKRVRDVTIETSDLAVLSDDILAQSLAKMRFLELSSTNLTSRQLTALFHLLKDSTEMEEIVLTRNILSHVPAEDLARSLSRLKKVKLEYSYLTSEQCIQIFKMALDERNQSLEHLKFGTFGYGWMDGRVMSYSLPLELEDLIRKAKTAGIFELEFQEFSRGRVDSE